MPTFSDTFSGSGALASVETGGQLWVPQRGTWTQSGGLATCSDAPSTSPFVVADFGTGDVDILQDIYNGYAGGDAIYFRAGDVNNWWRERCRYYYTTYTYQSGTTQVQTGTYNTGMYDFPATESWTTYMDPAPTAGTPYEGYATGNYDIESQPEWPDHIYKVTKRVSVTSGYYRIYWREGVTPHYEPTYETQPVYSTGYNYYYQFYLDKCVAGTISNVKASSSYSMFGNPKLRVVTDGPSITFYWYSGSTLQSSLNVSDTFNQGATMHGIGKGGNDSNAYQSGLSNFSLTTAGSTNYVPAILL